jgi:hypothetical protein
VKVLLIHHTDRGTLTFTDEFKRAIQDQVGAGRRVVHGPRRGRAPVSGSHRNGFQPSAAN